MADNTIDSALSANIPVLIDPTDGEQLATITSAARIVGQSPRTIYSWIERGLLEVRLTPVGRKRIVVRSLFTASADQPAAAPRQPYNRRSTDK